MKKHSEGQSIKKSLRMNAATFAVMVLLVAGCAMGAFATGSEDTTAAPADTTAAQASDAVAESAEATTVKDNSKGLHFTLPPISLYWLKPFWPFYRQF